MCRVVCEFLILLEITFPLRRPIIYYDPYAVSVVSVFLLGELLWSFFCNTLLIHAVWSVTSLCVDIVYSIILIFKWATYATSDSADIRLTLIFGGHILYEVPFLALRASFFFLFLIFQLDNTRQHNILIFFIKDSNNISSQGRCILHQGLSCHYGPLKRKVTLDLQHAQIANVLYIYLRIQTTIFLVRTGKTSC